MKLNITADEYKKIQDLQPAIYETDHLDEYVPLKREEALELLDLINRE